jgi:hypothetical protein
MNGRGYGARFDTDEISSSLGSTRRLRLALNVLCDGLDDLPDETSKGTVTDALRAVHDQVNQAETRALRMLGLAEHYLIIRPVSLLSPPPPQVLEKITAAVRTLAELGMLAGQNDAYYRDPE